MLCVTHEFYLAVLDRVYWLSGVFSSGRLCLAGGALFVGFRALGYEDTGYYMLAYNPVTDAYNSTYDYGITMAASFFGRLGFGQQWVFVDVDRDVAYGVGAG
jgi:hypothetical protein